MFDLFEEFRPLLDQLELHELEFPLGSVCHHDEDEFDVFLDSALLFGERVVDFFPSFFFIGLVSPHILDFEEVYVFAASELFLNVVDELQCEVCVFKHDGPTQDVLQHSMCTEDFRAGMFLVFKLF